MKGVAILGSTGSIGVQTLDIVRLHPDRFRIIGLAAGGNLDLLEQQAREFKPLVVSCATEAGARAMETRLADVVGAPRICHALDGMLAVATVAEAELVVGGLPGSTGLVPTFAAVQAGKDIALATKEVLVLAGGLFMDAVRERGVNLLPVDSEQSAIFQCLQGNQGQDLRRIILTASGGPFRDLTREAMQRVTREQALSHPRWKMGPKVTIDSATLMNKGLEVIEAAWLFDVPGSHIEVVIHPQSIVHSMVEFTDGSILAQLGATDMRIPISYALAFPHRVQSGTEPVSFPGLGALTFQEPDRGKFPLLGAAYQALEQGGSTPIILNAADEVAVDLFLAGMIPFDAIATTVLEALNNIAPAHVNSLEEIVEFHDEVSERVRATAVA
jgi:1-deoxy-D-xylulose-5-phosphate reductoisomerase